MHIFDIVILFIFWLAFALVVIDIIIQRKYNKMLRRTVDSLEHAAATRAKADKEMGETLDKINDALDLATHRKINK